MLGVDSTAGILPGEIEKSIASSGQEQGSLDAVAPDRGE
jgi:hypothetical protein